MSEHPRPVAYDVSLCVHESDIADEPFALFGPGAHVHPLRKLDDGSLRSGLVSLPAGFVGTGRIARAEVVQIFVRSGTITVGDAHLGFGGFVAVPRGGELPTIASETGAQVVVILDHGTAEAPQGNTETLVVPDVFAVEPIVPVIAGKVLEGFERRVLWEDAGTGADTRLLRIPAGFEGTGGPSYHPVEEEIFCLEGDIAPDDDTPMRAGSYLWNPRLSVHGFHEHTRGGCVLLEWHDGPWAYLRYEGEELVAS